MVPCHTYEWAIYVPLLNASCQTNVEAVRAAILRGPVSHIWMSHVPHMNESCPTYECVMSSSHMCRRSLKLILRGPVSHVWMSHVPLMNASCQTYVDTVCAPIPRVALCHTHEWVSRHVPLMNASCHTHECMNWLSSHKWMSHVTHANASCM